jgi:hypothetical protein
MSPLFMDVMAREHIADLHAEARASRLASRRGARRVRRVVRRVRAARPAGGEVR